MSYMSYMRKYELYEEIWAIWDELNEIQAMSYIRSMSYCSTSSAVVATIIRGSKKNCCCNEKKKNICCSNSSALRMWCKPQQLALVAGQVEGRIDKAVAARNPWSWSGIGRNTNSSWNGLKQVTIGDCCILIAVYHSIALSSLNSQ